MIVQLKSQQGGPTRATPFQADLGDSVQQLTPAFDHPPRQHMSVSSNQTTHFSVRKP